MQTEGSWLLPQGVDRERMLDMDRRLQPIRRKTFGLLAVGLLGFSPWVGWWTVAPLLAAVGVFWLAERVIGRSERPEYAIFAAWAASEVIIAGSVALTGSLRQVTLSWLAIPIVTLSARFSLRGVVAGVSLTLFLMAAVMLSAEPSAVLSDPVLLGAPVAIVVAIAMLSTALMRSDIEHRGEALIDQLTGMLNRNALVRRVQELEQQSEVSGDPVGLILADVDHFKGVNDAHGHVVGDSVLKDLAYVLRKHVRAFESAYRLGGEEFLILLPGATLAQTVKQAERLRSAVAGSPLGDGQRVTLSFGVAASRPGTHFEYRPLYEQADAALYEAKHAGRNRVSVGPTVAAPAPESASPRSRQDAVATAPAG